MTLENMIDALTMYYEASGYEDFYEKEIKGRRPDEIAELYEVTFADEMSMFWFKKAVYLPFLFAKINVIWIFCQYYLQLYEGGINC